MPINNPVSVYYISPIFFQSYIKKNRSLRNMFLILINDYLIVISLCFADFGNIFGVYVYSEGGGPHLSVHVQQENAPE